MRLNPFAAKPPLDEESVAWVFETFEWGLTHLNAEVFFRDSLLVVPDNEHYPGRASSIHEMATLMFDRTVEYAGLRSWPLQLRRPEEPMPSQMPRFETPTPLRGKGARTVTAAPDGAALPIGYDPKLVNNPQAMIAGFVQVLAHHLGSAVRAAPPGGIRNWPQTTEVLGAFLGFGILFANTAYNAPVRSCGSCGSAPTARQVYLSQYDTTYALALFCVLKGIPNQQVLKPLKSTLRGYFKRCRKDIERRTETLRRLRDIKDRGAIGAPTHDRLVAADGHPG